MKYNRFETLLNWGVIVATLFLLTGCDPTAKWPTPTVAKTRYDNIERVFYENWREMTIVMKNPETKQLSFHNFHGVQIDVFVDADPNEPMWAEASSKHAVLHLHETIDLKGGTYSVRRNKRNVDVHVQELQ